MEALNDLIFDALSPLLSNRNVRPDAFPQSQGVYITPGIRYQTIGGPVHPDLCGNDVYTGDPEIQFDLIHDTATARDALLPQVLAAIDAIEDPPGRLLGIPRTQYDAETKKFRASFDYAFHPSSSTDSP